MSSGPTLDVRTSTSGSVQVVHVAGDVDFAVSDQFAAAVEAALAAATYSLVIDMSSVRFIDSSAIGILIRAHKAMAARGGAFGLVAASPMILRVISIVRLDTVFSIYPDIASAVAAANNQG
jgi:anti-sigma B factor antagonist